MLVDIFLPVKCVPEYSVTTAMPKDASGATPKVFTVQSRVIVAMIVCPK